METSVDKQAIFDEYVKIILQKTAQLDHEQFQAYAKEKVGRFNQSITEWTQEGDEVRAAIWSVRLDALLYVIGRRNGNKTTRIH